MGTIWIITRISRHPFLRVLNMVPSTNHSWWPLAVRTGSAAAGVASQVMARCPSTAHTRRMVSSLISSPHNSRRLLRV